MQNNMKERHPLGALACVFFFMLLFLLSGAFTVFLSALLAEEEGAPTALDAPPPVVILDAGHGGEDGGAVGVNGALEKDLNLALTLSLAELLREAGVEVILTRSEDRLLLGEGENVKGHRKENDLKNRLAVAEEHPDAIFVSIHMNAFPDPSCRGLQVYYAKTEGSGLLASHIQGSVKARLQGDNKRTPHAAGSSIYLLERAVSCAVLIECGFLSNPDECARLSQKDYRSELCFSIFCGMMEYIKATEGDLP